MITFKSSTIPYVVLNLSPTKKFSVLIIFLFVLAALIGSLLVYDAINLSNKLSNIRFKEMNRRVEIQPKKNISRYNASQLDEIEKSLNQLTTPWGKLFQALENVYDEKVLVISLEPNADKRSFRLIAETQDVYQMLNYFHSLSKEESVSGIKLLSQKSVDSSKEQTIRFTIEGYWDIK